VFVADNVSVPAPDFVKVPVPVAIAAETVEVPTLSMVRFVFVPVIPPDIVKVVPESIWISDVAPRVIAPDQIFVPDVFCSAPADDEPSPEIVNASAMVTLPDTLIDAPLVTDVAAAVVPKLDAFDTAIEPALTVVAPV